MALSIVSLPQRLMCHDTSHMRSEMRADLTVSSLTDCTHSLYTELLRNLWLCATYCMTNLAYSTLDTSVDCRVSSEPPNCNSQTPIGWVHLAACVEIHCFTLKSSHRFLGSCVSVSVWCSAIGPHISTVYRIWYICILVYAKSPSIWEEYR
jgi:hypothetical protein